jgi:hypothetical protein
VDHIFFEIQTTGEYEIWVHQRDSDIGAQKYAVAWWGIGIGDVISMLGDWNFDEEVTGDDVPEMLKALTDLAAYKNRWGIDDTELVGVGDVNNDGVVTNKDIQAELDLVASLGGGSLAAVPEPTTLMLCVLAAPALILSLRKRA